jgi:hypothetical protein
MVIDMILGLAQSAIAGRFGGMQSLQKTPFLGHCGGFAAAVTEKGGSWGGFASPNLSTA